ncbi:MAG: hypothetical protein ACRDKG_00740 [Actinomycetota bacterium]
MPEIIAVNTKRSDDGTHDHVVLVGYYPGHITSGETITIPVERLIQKQWLGERFFIKLEDGTEAEVTAGKCPHCGLEPYFRTAADKGDEQRLLSLPPAG